MGGAHDADDTDAVHGPRVRQWDWILVAAVALGTVAVGAFDWRLGAAVLAVCLAAVWYWLGDVDEDG